MLFHNANIWGSMKYEEGKLSFVTREIKEGLVPDVKGMGAKDAVYLLKKAGLKGGMSGYGKVATQSISPGQRANKGSYIQITLKP